MSTREFPDFLTTGDPALTFPHGKLYGPNHPKGRPNTPSPITRYLVDISKGKDKTARASARKAVFKRLTPGRYRIRIAARNAIGTSPYSTWVRLRVR